MAENGSKSSKTDEQQPANDMVENGSKSSKPDEQQPANDLVKLKVKCNKDGEETYFAINPKAKIRKLLVSFCQHASIDYRSTRFVINQRTFSHEKTPNQMGLQDDDQIDALIDGNGA